MNDKIKNVLLASALIGTQDYSSLGFDIKDLDVVECLMNMYFFMLSDEMDEQVHEEYWKKFQQTYRKLTKEQQEIVKKDYIDIINAQDKNKEEKEKVKKKGNDKL